MIGRLLSKELLQTGEGSTFYLRKIRGMLSQIYSHLVDI